MTKSIWWFGGGMVAGALSPILPFWVYLLLGASVGILSYILEDNRG